MLDHIRQSLDRIAEKDRMRALKVAQLADGGRIMRDGRELLDLSSNDYLGLARHPLLTETAANFAREYGAGSGASRLITGTSAAHETVDARIAAFKGTETALVMASGWQANAGIIPALAKAAPTTAIFADELVHNSIHAGCRAARADVHFYAHNDAEDLERLLTTRGAGVDARIIITESCFSMDGDLADLPALNALADKHGALLYVDEAHATGVLGRGGAGLTADHAGAALVMGTFSKALGGFGAYVACSALLRDYLVNMCPGLIFSTAPPPAVLGAMSAALELVPTMDGERAHLAKLSQRMRDGLQGLGYDTLGSASQIVPLVVGSEKDALALGEHLLEAGIAGLPIRPPTVPKGTSRIRLALRSTLSSEDVDLVLDCVSTWRR
ncbi:aminotransferase class I/II-fold pyridoxal phosphate-dependent enzyme [Aurantiacibacter gangjinensis]|uniref:8-amino-7-oxononanoate synthase n=1 Tax=Aurantiacibacter gangjinensis TaxID=502682 RepID=A0A0G9MP47_9SPHN|nr:8-amino-7-oxononanoate synthase [Aurantiacibacter gangjinensis]APE29332.1 8-amino-7-oxononanoate synthase [Aurantiacibacter gangjinensis]KLE31083.1 8-amino-7-oxononanoate synthase [Aurantiacibacter gangjinensis]